MILEVGGITRTKVSTIGRDYFEMGGYARDAYTLAGNIRGEIIKEGECRTNCGVMNVVGAECRGFHPLFQGTRFDAAAASSSLRAQS